MQLMNKNNIRYLYVVMIILGLVITSQAQDNNFIQNFSKVSLSSVYDGDTFRVHLNCKYRIFCKSMPVRVRGIDCPEIRSDSAETKALAKQAKVFTKNFLKSGKILLRNCGRDKYFRLLCDVKVNGQNLSEELIKAGHAIPYNGGAKNL